MHLDIYAASDVGLVRRVNQDMAAVGKRLLRDDQLHTSARVDEKSIPFVLAVADGVGGGRAGHVASRHVLSSLVSQVPGLGRQHSAERLGYLVRELARLIHDDLVTRGEGNPRHAGMATTLSALLFYEKQCYLLHAGDSRLYHFRNGGLTQISRDHSLRDFSGDVRVPGNILANCFGAREGFFVDFLHLGSCSEPGDTMLLCSDGLSDMVSDKEITAILSDHQSVKEQGIALADAARLHGASDNVTFVAVQFSDDV